MVPSEETVQYSPLYAQPHKPHAAYVSFLKKAVLCPAFLAVRISHKQLQTSSDGVERNLLHYAIEPKCVQEECQVVMAQRALLHCTQKQQHRHFYSDVTFQLCRSCVALSQWEIDSAAGYQAKKVCRLVHQCCVLAPVYIHSHSIDGISVRTQQCAVLVSGNVQAAYDAILGPNGDGETIRSKPNCSHRRLMLSLHWPISHHNNWSVTNNAVCVFCSASLESVSVGAKLPQDTWTVHLTTSDLSKDFGVEAMRRARQFVSCCQWCLILCLADTTRPHPQAIEIPYCAFAHRYR